MTSEFFIKLGEGGFYMKWRSVWLSLPWSDFGTLVMPGSNKTVTKMHGVSPTMHIYIFSRIFKKIVGYVVS